MLANRPRKQVPPFTAETDRQIIAGFWGDRKAMLELLAERGFCRRAVFHRAEKIGLMRGRALRQASRVLLVRQCLRCEQVFVAEGPYNRLCRRCRTVD
jgi:hypothetical protein